MRPILETRCHACHGAGRKRGSLGLETRREAMAGGNSTLPALVPGDPEASELFRRVTSDDPAQRMPFEREPLERAQIEVLRRWIAQGATWPDEDPLLNHWAYQAPVAPPVPEDPSGWARNEIDAFVLRRQLSAGLEPSDPSPTAVLTRRLFLDLTGLPPSPEQMDAFVADSSPDAYERLVDRLLQSPQHAERMTMWWLDLARYADTNGYHVDIRRSVWLYRDWVIEAFQRNMPFDQFTIEQLAGDLLPDPTLAQQIATGFHRNTMHNDEGGIDPEEFRAKAVADRVSTTMSVWMGTTMACAECHNHKYDPFTQVEFYQLYAFFNNVDEAGGGTGVPLDPIVRLPLSANDEAALASLQREIEELRRQRAAAPQVQAAQAEEWARRVRAGKQVTWRALPIEEIDSRRGVRYVRQEDDSLRVEGDAPDSDTLHLKASVSATVTAIRFEAFSDPEFPDGGAGLGFEGQAVLSELSIKAAPASEPSRAGRLEISAATAAHSDPDHLPFDAVDLDPSSGWRVSTPSNRKREIVFELAEPLCHGEGSILTFLLLMREGLFGRFRLSATDTPAPVLLEGRRPQSIQALLDAPEQLSQAQQAQLQEYFDRLHPDPLAERIDSRRRRIESLRKRPPGSPVMQEMAVPRQTHVLRRGNFLDPTVPVEPGTPAVLHPLRLEHGGPANRLDLARWLVRPDNPLTARVTVNHLWQLTFGTGLVKTSEDFGTRGEPPSHAELLDWLATELVRRDWDIREILRLIVTSTTYRQSSHVRPCDLERDPENRLLARSPRYRWPAETVRDNALAISGLLSRKVGGPSVFPYQPEGLWAEKGLNTYGMPRWTTSEGEDLHRRGMYTFWRRSVLYPTFATFDAPERVTTCIRRANTNTPLQALVTLNDPCFVEAARAFAKRILDQGGETDPERLCFAFRACVARAPEDAETRILEDLLTRQKELYVEDPAAAEALLEQGESALSGTEPITTLAAWTVVANALLNLDETQTRN